ncbi:MAG: STAS domain-containing protein [Candidatus Hydrogenedentota bacterium]
MEITKVEIKSKKGIKVKGEIDMHTASTVHKSLIEIIESISNGDKIYIDMSEVVYMDSSGIAIFIDGLRHINKKKGELILYNPSNKIMDVFGIARLQSVFKIERSN